jgi:hypothetical protein
MAGPSSQVNIFEGSMNSTNNTSQSVRQAPSPNSSLASGQGSIMAPLPMGHQQDLNFLYRQMHELGEILKSNRDKVNGITKAAEEVMVGRTNLNMRLCS